MLLFSRIHTIIHFGTTFKSLPYLMKLALWSRTCNEGVACLSLEVIRALKYCAYESLQPPPPPHALTRIAGGGLESVGRTYTHSAGKSPLAPVLSQCPKHQPDFITSSPVSFSSLIRSPFRKLRNAEPSPVCGGVVNVGGVIKFLLL